MRVIIPFALIAIFCLATAATYFYIKYRNYREIVDGLDDPLVYLSRKERRRLAREQIFFERGERINNYYRHLLGKDE